MKKWFLALSQRVKIFLLPAGIGTLFLVLAGRIAYGSPFPLPYDEAFHFGLIKLYTHHLNPFLGAQPAGADAYGAVTRDPSYLYHYLMSFPLRLIELFTNSQYSQVLILRSFSIALGLTTLYLVFRLGRRLGLSAIGAQLVALGLAVTPVFYDVAAQINYDNLLLPLCLGSVLWSLTIADCLRQKSIPVGQVMLLASVCLFGCLVKFTYLPVGLAIAIYLIIVALRNLGFTALFRGFRGAFAKFRTPQRLMLISLLVLASVCWMQRYGVNLARYHNPVPDCGVVLSTEQCDHYSVWNRNNQLRQTVVQRPINGLQLSAFTKYWLRSMYIQVYSTVHSKPGVVVFVTQNALKTFAKLALLGGAVCALLFMRSLGGRRRAVWMVAGLVGLCYVGSLWGQNFTSFHTEHALMGIQGRYLLPIVPFLYAGAVAGYEAAWNWVLGLELARLYAALSGFIVVCWLAIREIRRIGYLTLRMLIRRSPEEPAGNYYLRPSSLVST